MDAQNKVPLGVGSRIFRHLAAWMVVIIGLLCLVVAQGPAAANSRLSPVSATSPTTGPPTPTPTPTPVPIDGTSVTCALSLDFSSNLVSVGDTIDVTLSANCLCGPLEPTGSICGFVIDAITEIDAPLFDAPIAADVAAPSAPIQLRAARALSSRVRIGYSGDVTVVSPDAGEPVRSIAQSFVVSAPLSVYRSYNPALSTIVHARSCLAGSGRSDINIVNTGEEAALYRIEYEGLTPRERVVEAGDWWRMPVTGRDGSYWVVIRRDGVPNYGRYLDVRCGVVGTPEVAVLNACRGGYGYLLFQFQNYRFSPRPYVIEFEGVRNRSTTAAADGQAVRAVTGRPNGDFEWTVRSGAEIVRTGTVTVDCT